MTLQTFNVFGKATIERYQIEIQYVMFKDSGKQIPMRVTSEEESAEIPKDTVGEFLFAVHMDKNDFKLFTYESKPIEDVEITGLPQVKELFQSIATNVKGFLKD